MRIGMEINYSGGFRETVEELADYERAGLDVMEHVHRGIGLTSFLQPDPIERISRDLATYLRQPAPDGAMADAAACVLAAEAPLRQLWSGR